MKPMDSVVHKFLRIVGSPFADSSYEPNTQDASQFYQYALKNRMSLLYLDALEKIGRLGSLKKEHDKLIDKHTETERAIHRVSKMMDRACIDYALFKSIRPYREVTVDIDILTFDSSYLEVVRAMQRAGYVFLGRGPLSTTFQDSEARIDLDIYDEVGVSHIIYLDKDILKNFVGNRKLSNGDVVRSLYPEADLLAVIAHSVLKEQIYVLSEYYTTLYYLAGMDYETLSSFLSLVSKCRIRSAVEVHLGITALLHWEAHGFIPVCLMRLLKKLDVNCLEPARFVETGFHMPYKYHPITIIKAFNEKLGEEKARRSFASQTFNMLNPKFALSLVEKVFHHLSRETY